MSYMFMRDISAQVDATTGQIYSYSLYQRIGSDAAQENPDEKNEGKSVTRTQAEKLAINSVIALVPDATEQFKLSSVLEVEDARTFIFQRYLNGIAVKDDLVQVQVLNDGTISEFYANLAATPEQLPASKEPAISYEEAKAAYLEEFKLVLAYSRYGGQGTSSGQVTPSGINLAYMLHGMINRSTAAMKYLMPIQANGRLCTTLPAWQLKLHLVILLVMWQKRPSLI